MRTSGSAAQVPAPPRRAGAAFCALRLGKHNAAWSIVLEISFKGLSA